MSVGLAYAVRALVEVGWELEVVTAAAARWLEAIEDESFTAGLPLSVTAVVARARSSVDDVARARLRIRDGRWLTLYAEAMTQGADARVAVVLEPTRPQELAAIMARRTS